MYYLLYYFMRYEFSKVPEIQNDQRCFIFFNFIMKENQNSHIKIVFCKILPLSSI